MHSRRHPIEVDAGTRPFASFDAPILVKKKEREDGMCMCLCVYVRAYVVNKYIIIYVGTLCDLFCAYAMSFDSSICFYIILFHRDMYEHVSVQMCAYVDVCVYIYIYTYIYTYTYICIHIYVYI